MTAKKVTDILKIIPAFAVAATALCACGGKPKNEAPVITGAHDHECAVNERIDLLYRVAALDREEGDITPKMEIDVMPYAKVENGVAEFPSAGTYEVTYFVEDSEGEIAEASIYVTAYERDTNTRFMEHNGFFATADGGAEIAREGICDGRYTVEATGAAKPSDATLSRIFEFAPETDYTIEYTVKANAMGTLRVVADETEIARKQIEENAETVFSFDYRSPKSEEPTDPQDEGAGEGEPDEGTDEEQPLTVEGRIDIQFGSLGENIVFQTTRVKVIPKDVVGNYEEQLDGFDFSENGRVHDRIDVKENVAGTVRREQNSATLEITKAGNNDWCGGMFIDTGIALGSGDAVKVAFDYSATDEFDFLWQCKQWGPNETIDRVNIASGYGRREVEFTVPSDRTGTLWLYVQSGDKLNTVTVSNLSVQKRTSGETAFSFDKFNESHAEGGMGELSVEYDTLKYKVASFGNSDWHNKIESPSFYVDGAVDKYIISFKIKSSKRIKTVFCAPRAGGWDPNLIWKSFYIEEGERYYFFTTDNVQAAGDHVLLWQFGASENQSYKNVDIEISDIRVDLRHGLLDYNDD